VVQSFIEKLGFVAEKVFVTANNRLFAELYVEVALLLVTEADTVLARFFL